MINLIEMDVPVSYQWPFKISFAFAESFDEWAFGLCTELAALGMAALVIGPWHIQFEWDIV